MGCCHKTNMVAGAAEVEQSSYAVTPGSDLVGNGLGKIVE
jgi:hypothetical protein